MKKFVLFLLFYLSIYKIIYANNCFIAKEGDKILQQVGEECNKRFAPCSTFKIALSLIGYDAGILKDTNKPKWQVPENVDPYINVCKGIHDPISWMRDSCLWYSQILVNKIGTNKFQDYVTKFSYGNMDLSGGLTASWVSSSLKISPWEQIAFIEKIINEDLPVTQASYKNTEKIMFIQEMAGGWKLYGKTGNGALFDDEGNKTDLQQGWFVGYIAKDNRKIAFVSHLSDQDKMSSFASFRARNEALIKLWYIIDELEK